MNKFILFAVLLLGSLLRAQIFVSPDGDDTNPGTFDLPYRSLTKAISVAGPDSLIYMRGGVYNDSTTHTLNKSGTPDHYIKVWAYPGETPILDFSNQPVSTSSRGIRITHNYWHIKGLVIRNAKDNGIYIQSFYNIVENCVLYNNNDTGIQISNNGSYNLVLNCDSYLNNDPLTFGENADGFAAKLGIGPGNVFRGCRAWNNSDDGYDMYEAADTVLVDGCWSFRNGYNIWGFPNFSGDGNGFKLGGNYFADPHKIIRCVAFDNPNKGFDQNNNTAGITVYNNTAWGNGSRNFSFPTQPTSGAHTLKNNISFNGSISLASNTIQEANSWQGFTVTTADFISLDSTLAIIPRDTTGCLPYIDLLRLASGSSLIDAGVYVGLPYNGSAPDLGVFEFGEIVPVELVSFTAVVSGNSIILKWITSSELNNQGFEIQRKFDNDKFLTIGFVPGAGTTTQSNEYNFITECLEQGTIIYKLKQIDFSGAFSYSDEILISNNIPDEFSLSQNFPNPFNPSTKFVFEIPAAGKVTLEVFDILGNKVAEVFSDYLTTGQHEITWNISDNFKNFLPSGIYFTTLHFEDKSQTIKLILLK
jgi:hypothetical protein